MLAIGGCGGDSDAPAAAPPVVPPAATGSVSGTVVASGTGLALAGVAVTADSRSTSSTADGSYTLTDVPAGAAKVLAFERAGHAKSLLVVAVSAGATARANARLTPIVVAQSFDVAAGATVAVAGKAAQVSLPAAGLVTTTGVAATGAVMAEVTPINPATDPANMPGNYTAQAAVAGGAAQPIESFGALNVTLKDAAGKALNLAPGKTATIRIPLATRSVAGSRAASPSIELDEQLRPMVAWVEDGAVKFKRFDGSAWVQAVGGEGPASSGADRVRLASDRGVVIGVAASPVIAWTEGAGMTRALKVARDYTFTALGTQVNPAIMRALTEFDVTWENAGAIVTWCDGDSPFTIRSQRWNGSTWVNVAGNQIMNNNPNRLVSTAMSRNSLDVAFAWASIPTDQSFLGVSNTRPSNDWLVSAPDILETREGNVGPAAL